MSMALCCDFAFGAEDAKMVIYFCKYWFCSGLRYYTYAYKECRTVQEATDLLMGGRRFTELQMQLSGGMIWQPTPKEELEDLVKKYIKKYSQGPAVAYAQIKRMINRRTMRELNAHAGGSRSSVHLQ